jgi:hypothetical protein
LDAAAVEMVSSSVKLGESSIPSPLLDAKGITDLDFLSIGIGIGASKSRSPKGSSSAFYTVFFFETGAAFFSLTRPSFLDCILGA